LFERVLKPLFSVEKRIRSWSFSTYEVSDADHGNLRRPELIFLPKLPDHAAEIRHQRVFFDETTQVEGQYQHLAQHLIAEYLRLGCEEYAVAMGGVVGSMPNIESRIRYLLSSGLAPPQYVPESAYAAQPTPAPQPGGAQKAESPWTQAVGGHSPYRHQPVGAPAALRPRPEPRPVVPSRNVPDDEEIVRQLANAQDEKGIDYWLAALCERSTYAPVTDRWGLICRYGILELLPRHLYLWDLIVAYGHVLEFAFGAGAKALHEQSYFALVEKRIKHPKVSPLFGCMVYYFVKDSRMGPHCTKLLHERLGRLTSISLVPEVMDKLNSRSVTAGRGERLVALFRNSQVLILLILLLLVSIAVVSMIIVV
ncbi:MAG: hypothetical protein ACREYC_28810, partial [Gammaproteobacteria bacterium]